MCCAIFTLLVVGLVAGGKVHGQVELTGCQKLSQKDLEENFEKHRVEDLGCVSYATTFAWVLSHPKRFDCPQRHMPKTGARMWINLEYPSAQQRAQRWMARLGKLTPDDTAGMASLILDASVSDFCRYKTKPFFRVQDKNVGVSQKFGYVPNDRDSRYGALKSSLEFLVQIGALKDEATCMQLPELKEYMDKNKLSKTGNADSLRARMVEHRAVDISKKVDQTHAADLRKQEQEHMIEVESKKTFSKISSSSKGQENFEQENMKNDGKKVEEGSKQEKAIEGSLRCKFFDPFSILTVVFKRWLVILYLTAAKAAENEVLYSRWRNSQEGLCSTVVYFAEGLFQPTQGIAQAFGDHK